ncbi:hypothetical protein L6452_44598 [Arctium lappa]|uniref:Uncharacterized protein n=1 Tax=Arctium lappa TaxID=4217 RepID=A0ACB8XGV2_ARCLA|nr:hypothetical protein L6452_44598 [Arctium lappa]
MHLDALNKEHPKARPTRRSDRAGNFPSSGGLLGTYFHSGTPRLHPPSEFALNDLQVGLLENLKICQQWWKMGGEDEDEVGDEASKPKPWVKILTLETLGDDLVFGRSLDKVG